jgi:hypothetical protein
MAVQWGRRRAGTGKESGRGRACGAREVDDRR